MRIKICMFLLAAFFIGCKKDNLVVATSANFAPFEYMDGNEFKGIDIDIIRDIAKELNMELVIKNMEFDSVIQSVASRNVDVGISGLTINETRQKVVNFTEPYFSATQVVVFNNNDDRFVGIDSKDALVNVISMSKGIKIGVQTGSTGEFYAKGDSDWGFDGFKDANVLSFSNGAMAMSAMLNGQIDIVIVDEMPAKGLVKANEGSNYLAIPLTEEKYSISVRKDKGELLKRINDILERMQEDGSIDEIVNKHYNNL